MIRYVVVILALLYAPCAYPQTLEIDAGDSTLLRGEGAGATLFLPDSTIYGGLAYGNGAFHVSGSDTFAWHNDIVTLGSRPLGFSFDGTGLGFSTIGASIERQTPTSDTVFFAGGTGLGYSTPFLQQSTNPTAFGAGVFLKRQFRGVKLYDLQLMEGSRYTAAVGADWLRWRKARLSGSAGLLNNQRFLNGSGSYAPTPGLILYASRQDIFAPQHAIGNTGGASFTVGRFSAQAAVNESMYEGRSTTGETVGGGLKAGPIGATVAWYKSGDRVMTSEAVTENLGWHHLSATETVTQSNGQNSYAFGGGIHTNRLAVSVNHSIVFLINNEGFSQVTGVSISLRMHDATANFQTITTPLGQTLYTITGEDYATVGANVRGMTVHAPAIGDAEFTGHVVDEAEQPVWGAAIQVGKVIAYTDDDGFFSVRARKAGTRALAVIPATFATPGAWEVVTCPSEIASGNMVAIAVRRAP